ncbi:MAG: NADH-quinone oxidoreductase subunit N [Clostridiales bacterium]|jgi:NADH-quinone oxidoreductase subunit N|nr:NADH-quinone oxidoreductase subunit N [Eubacteriales bacterium]MDH7566355.1 NADH-quinone oxidoreductase subunit N [Clostridiales bacterium]
MDFSAVTIEILVALLGLVLLVTGLLLPPDHKKANGYIAVVGLLGILAFSLSGDAGRSGTFLYGLYTLDSLSKYFKEIFMIAAILVILMSLSYTKRFREGKGEYFSILLFALLGMMVMVSSNDFITLYIGLELMTISFVILTAFDRSSLKSSEAGVKYVLLSAMSSAVLLYGLSIFYGLSGTTEYAGFITCLQSGGLGPALILAIVMVLAGFGFKISAVPFHMWSPDIYEGAPTPITAFLATGSKAAGFAVLIRLLLQVLPSQHVNFSGIIIMLAVLTIIVGNLIAIPQKNIKRMLAFSSIAHAGYILLGLVAFTGMGVGAMLYYIFIYIFANAGAFASVTALSNITGSDEIEDFGGMWKRSPLVTAVLMISLLSMAGIPPAAGFVGKFYLFASIIKEGYVWLALVAIGMSVVSLYYYVMVIRVMLTGQVKSDEPVTVPASLKTVMVVSSAATIFLGVYAGPLTSWTSSVASMFVK